MSAEYQGQDPLEIAKQAERDLNSLQAKGNVTSQKAGQSDSGNSRPPLPSIQLWTNTFASFASERVRCR